VKELVGLMKQAG